MIFKIEKDRSVFDSNPELRNFECMSACNDKELKWIFLVYDYDTPLRKMPFDKRIIKAAEMAGFPMEKDGSRFAHWSRDVISMKLDRTRKAIQEFNLIQYDQEKELIKAYDTEINQIIEMIGKKDKSEKEWTFVKDFNFQIPKIIKAKNDLEEAIGRRGDLQVSMETIEPAKPISLLDTLNNEDDI